MPGKTRSLNARDMQTKGQLGSATGSSVAQLPLLQRRLCKATEDAGWVTDTLTALQGYTWADIQCPC